MSTVRKTLARWLEVGRKIGFLVALVAASAALGFVISWPLWLFATSARRAYTITVLALAGAGIIFLVFRAIRRSRRATRDPGRPRRTPLSVILTFLMVVVGLAGAYLGAALLARGLLVIAAADIVVWAALLWVLGRARSAAKNPKVRTLPAENSSR
jgi:hypothetical protein